MKPPTVPQARQVCAALGARGVIVLAFSRDNVAGASYGETKAECGQLGYTLDRIIEHLCDGRIPMWVTRADAEARARRTLREGIQNGTYCPGCRQPKGDCDCDERWDADHGEDAHQ